MKYKVGDKVKIIEDSYDPENTMIGQIGEVIGVNPNHSYPYDILTQDGQSMVFYEDELELYVEEVSSGVNGTSSMTKETYMKFHQECCDKMVSITKAKNSDYTGNTDDPFANFTQVEKAGICSTEVGFLTRMSDKMSRINSYVQKGDLLVKDESVLDTLLDLANYSILFAGYLKSKKDAQNT